MFPWLVLAVSALYALIRPSEVVYAVVKPLHVVYNCAYASLTLELGSEAMNEIVDQLGLTSSYDINGIESVPGSFNFDTYNINLGWAGVGQFEDQVNPLSLMVYMGAIAGGGTASSPFGIHPCRDRPSDAGLCRVDLCSHLYEIL